MIKNLFFSSLCLFIINTLSANHIAGGDFTVRHIEGDIFEAKLILYRDCEGNLVVDNVITVSVYDAVTDAYLADLAFTMSNPQSDIIPLGNSCYDPGLCVESQTYIQEFSLPNNPNGYYMSWERCCRNEIAINVQAASQGMVFTVEIPDPALQNSTPEFLPYPSDAFLCVNGVSTIDFAATDADGDELVYSLIDPLKGDATSPFNPLGPGGAWPRPYSVLNWSPGFSLADPVGGDEPMTINSETGLVTAQPNTIGFYTIAVKVEEFRDGVKIGEVIREVQVAGLVCNIDLPSEIVTPNNDTIFDVFANTDWCIEINVTDPNEGDTLFVQASGDIMDGTILPSAVYPDANGFSSIVQDLCWSPVCENVRDEPYIVTITAFSRGCANEILVTTQDIYINVILDDNVPTELSGPLLDGEPGRIIDLYNPSTYCFNFVFTDNNEADSIFVTASSEIFDLPNAEQLEPDFDQGTITLPYCWNVECVDVRDEPYFVDFEVITTNCLVQDTAFFSVPIFVVVPENEPTTFAQPAFDSYTFEFYSADTFCIPVTVFDENFFDTLSVTASSPILELAGNPATFEPLDGLSIVEGNLCWVPQCSDVRPEPYTVTFRATANSCKTDDEVLRTVEIFLVLPPESAPFFEQPSPGLFIEHIVGDDPISLPVIARDVDPYDTLTLTATSTAFDARGINAVFEPFTNREVVVSQFFWGPDCPNIDEEPYVVTFEVNSRSCQKNVTTALDIQILVTTPTKGIIEPIQNVFTPNGDGKNDFWTIENKDDVCLLNFKTLVFDRWGREVYQSNDPAFQWDGVFGNGNRASNGTYFHIIEYFYRDAVKTYSGDIQILE